MIVRVVIVSFTGWMEQDASRPLKRSGCRRSLFYTAGPYLVVRNTLGPRSRFAYLALALLTISAGLIVHRSTHMLTPVPRDVIGDALWAMMMVWWIGVLRPRAPARAKAAVAFAICVLVEASQLIHGPAIDRLRASTAGHLVLGSGFDPRDFAAYALGVLVALAILARFEPRCD